MPAMPAYFAAGLAGPAGFVVIAALGLLAALLVIASHARRAR